MGRTVKDAATGAFRHEAAGDLRAHMPASVAACNFAERPKALRWRTPFQAVCGAWRADPIPFELDPRHPTPGPHT